MANYQKINKKLKKYWGKIDSFLPWTQKLKWSLRPLFCTFEFLIDEHVRLFIFKKKSHLGIFIRGCAFIYFDKEKFRQGKTLHLNASNESEIVIFRKYFTLI